VKILTNKMAIDTIRAIKKRETIAQPDHRLKDYIDIGVK
jgi:hypothetical protein